MGKRLQRKTHNRVDKVVFFIAYNTPKDMGRIFRALLKFSINFKYKNYVFRNMVCEKNKRFIT